VNKDRKYGKNGKRVPRTYKCRLCNEAIYFDERIAESGKKIHIEILTKKPYACPKRTKILPKNRVF